MNQVLQKVKQTKENDFVHTEEFKSAVQSTVEDILSKLNLNKAAPVDNTESFVKSLVHEMRTMSGADNGKIQIDPVVMNERSIAKGKMDKLCKRFHAEDPKRQDPPRYKAVSLTYIAHRLYEPGMTLGWYGAPNEALVPTNPKARAVYDLFKQSIGLPHDPIPEEAHKVDKYGRVVYEEVDGKLAQYSTPENHPLLVSDDLPDMSFFKIEDMIPPCDLIVD